MAFAGAKGRLYDQVRCDGYVMVTGDRIPGLSGISAPVWRGGGELVGALTLTAPEQRVQPSFVEELRASATRLTQALGGPAAGHRSGNNEEH
jgi:DNA-binding IclR family transcriptional regulator